MLDCVWLSHDDTESIFISIETENGDVDREIPWKDFVEDSIEVPAQYREEWANKLRILADKLSGED